MSALCSTILFQLLVISMISLVSCSTSGVEYLSSVVAKSSVNGSFLVIDASAWSRVSAADPSLELIGKGEYNITMPIYGWDILRITTEESATDDDQSYGAGFWEGFVTRPAILLAYQNLYGKQLPGNLTMLFVTDHMTWLQQVLPTFKDNEAEPVWMQSWLLWQQFQGLVDGFNNATTPTDTTRFSLLDMMLLTGQTDLWDISLFLHGKTIGDFHGGVGPVRNRKDMESEAKTVAFGDWMNMSKKEFQRYFAKRTHCSALIKLLPDMSDIYFGHTTWFEYSTMYRMYKHYNFNFESVFSSRMSFSSYPGMLSSGDDFYVLDSGLAVMETSIDILNRTMYDGNIKIQCLFYWMRVTAANRLAESAPEWVELFSFNNSGTYNNQWMVLDFNLFYPGEGLDEDALWIAEQYPGVVVSADMTETLQYGYWPSYNVPSFTEYYALSGYEEATYIFGTEMTDYQSCVRAEIFRRDQGAVETFNDFKFLLQYNDYKNDPISMEEPLYSIAARNDLSIEEPTCNGAIDSKVTSFSMMLDGSMSVQAYSGPTLQQGVFAFTPEVIKMCNVSVIGLPVTFNFDWISIQNEGDAVPVGGSSPTAFPRLPDENSKTVLTIIAVALVGVIIIVTGIVVYIRRRQMFTASHTPVSTTASKPWDSAPHEVDNDAIEMTRE